MGIISAYFCHMILFDSADLFTKAEIKDLTWTNTEKKELPQTASSCSDDKKTIQKMMLILTLVYCINWWLSLLPVSNTNIQPTITDIHFIGTLTRLHLWCYLHCKSARMIEYELLKKNDYLNNWHASTWQNYLSRILFCWFSWLCVRHWCIRWEIQNATSYWFVFI